MSDLVKTNVSMFLEVVKKKHIRMFCAKRNNSICPKRGSYQLRVLFNYHMNDVYQRLLLLPKDNIRSFTHLVQMTLVGHS